MECILSYGVIFLLKVTCPRSTMKTIMRVLNLAHHWIREWIIPVIDKSQIPVWQSVHQRLNNILEVVAMRQCMFVLTALNDGGSLLTQCEGHATSPSWMESQGPTIPVAASVNLVGLVAPFTAMILRFGTVPQTLDIQCLD